MMLCNCRIHEYGFESLIHVHNLFFLLLLLPSISPLSKFSRCPAGKTPQQIFHLQLSCLVTVAMHGGSLPSPVHPIGMSMQPGSLKTAFYITAYNEKSFISVLSKCQSSFNDLLSTHTHTHSERSCISCARRLFSALLAFFINTNSLILIHSTEANNLYHPHDPISSVSYRNLPRHLILPHYDDQVCGLDTSFNEYRGSCMVKGSCERVTAPLGVTFP